MGARVMGEHEALLEAIADSTRDLLRELAAVRDEGEALRRELEMAWGTDDNRPTSIPLELDWDDLEFDRRDTLPITQ
jgi:hypothetical protein